MSLLAVRNDITPRWSRMARKIFYRNAEVCSHDAVENQGPDANPSFTIGCTQGRLIHVKPLDRVMRYQLTLQFRGDSFADFDAMVALENELTEELGDSSDVDGHDCGAGEINIFIFTSDPADTFRRVRPVLERTGRLQAVTAAYREVRGNRYTVVWPEGSQKEFRVA